MQRQAWFVYILRCKDGTFYTGITNNVKERLRKHNSGKGARYTRTRRPVRLIYQVRCPNQGRAMKREKEIKHLPRTKKADLVRQYRAKTKRAKSRSVK